MTENRHIAFCGINCMKCGAYIVKQENSDKIRQETSAMWKEKYNLDVKPEDINCDGCLTELIGNLYCPIRVCARGKGVLNCAYCKDYICEQLDKYFQTTPLCREVLDGIQQVNN